MKKKFIYFILMSCLIIIVSSIYTNANENVSIFNQWPEDGLYFMKWNSYHGYFVGTEPYIQLSLVFVHAKDPNLQLPPYQKYTFGSDQGELTAIPTGYHQGSKEPKYSLYTLGLRVILPSTEPKTYQINQLIMVDDKGNRSVHDIGNWIIEIQAGEQPKDFQIGRRTFATTTFDWYRGELTNKTDQIMEIEDLEFRLDEMEFLVKIQSSADFNLTEDLSTQIQLGPKEKRTFEFGFTQPEEGNSLPSFISLQPFLHYKVAGQERKMVLPAAIYSAYVQDQDVLAWVRQIANERETENQ